MDSGVSLLLSIATSTISLLSNWAVIGGVSFVCMYLAILVFRFVFTNVFKVFRFGAHSLRTASRSNYRKD